MLHVFNLDATKVDRDVAHVAMACMLQVYVLNIAAVFKCMCNCMFQMFQQFQMYVANILFGCYI
jgi:hypothetical protein